MKPKKIMFLLFILLLFWQGTANAQTIHVILAGDYRGFAADSSAQRGIRLDLRNMRDFFETMVSQDKLKFYEVDPEMATPKAILNTIGSVKPAKEDTVVFYYTGHGANAAEGKAETAGQYFELKDESGENIELYRTTVCNQLLATGAHFVVCFSDCCNVYKPVQAYREAYKGVAPISNEFEPIIQQLFLNPNGMLDMTTSEYAQASFTNSSGSIGTLAWIEILKDENKSGTTITWDAVIKNMNVRVNELFKERFANNEALEQGSQDYYVYEWPGTPRFGARVQVLGSGNVYVTEIVPGSIAEKGGLKVNDTIRKIGGVDIENEKEFVAAIDKASGNTTFEIKRTNSNNKIEVFTRDFDFGGGSSNEPEVKEPKFGLKFEEVDGGLKVIEVIPGGTAENKFKKGDVILKIEGTTVDTKNGFAAALSEACQKEYFTIVYRRNGEVTSKVINTKDMKYSSMASQTSKPDDSGQDDPEPDDSKPEKPKPEKTYVFGAKVKGNVIEEVYEGSPADIAGLQQGDKIVSFNGKTINNSTDFTKAVDDSPAVGELVIIKKGEKTRSNIDVMLNNNKTYVFGAKVKGNVVDKVYPGSPADEVGLQEGDKIKKFNSKTISSSKEFSKAVDDSPVDAELEIERDGETIQLKPTLNK